MESHRCPYCFHNLVGFSPTGVPYSKVLGVVIDSVHKGVLFWECPHCQGRWHRFRNGTDLHKKAEFYVRELATTANYD